MTRTRHDDQFDEAGILRDGARFRVPMQFRDSASNRQQFTDGVGGITGNRPGWRIPVNDRRGSSLRDAAYSSYQTRLVNAYKLKDGEVQCSDCDGDGDINGEQCSACGGDGTLPDSSTVKNLRSSNEDRAADHRPIEQRVREHQTNMARIYDAYSREISEMWRSR
jgi:hypothetical protein